MITRRQFLDLTAKAGLAAAGLVTYATAAEAGVLLRTVSYSLTPPNWTPGLKLRLVVLADPHVCEPWMPLSRWRQIIAQANGLEPDVIILLGDYTTDHRFVRKHVPVAEVAQAARALSAPLGVFASTGNHDWWSDKLAQKTQAHTTETHRAFAEAGIPVLNNRALRLMQGKLPFWISGTDSMIAIVRNHRDYISRADLPRALADVSDDAPIIHLAHEPDLFTTIPERVSLTLSGHTHGGQINILGWSPYVPSAWGRRFIYGHIVEGNRHLIVSGGIGCSVVPLRFMRPPEITLIELGTAPVA